MENKQFKLSKICLNNPNAICDNGEPLTQKEVVVLLNEQKGQIKKLEETIDTIAKDYEEYHGMDIRNAEWFTCW